MPRTCNLHMSFDSQGDDLFSLPHPPALTRLSRAGMLQVITCSPHIFFLGLLFIALWASVGLNSAGLMASTQLMPCVAI